MNVILLLLLLLVSGISLYVIIPTFAPKDQQDIIQKWVGLAFNGLLYAIILIESRFQYMNTLQAFFFLLFTIGFALAGIYWWIPTYIPKEKQHETTITMFNMLSLSVLLMNTGVKAVPTGTTYYQRVQQVAGRRR